MCWQPREHLKTHTQSFWVICDDVLCLIIKNVYITVVVINNHKKHESQRQKQSQAHVVVVQCKATQNKQSDVCSGLCLKCVFLPALPIKTGVDFWNLICGTVFGNVSQPHLHFYSRWPWIGNMTPKRKEEIKQDRTQRWIPVMVRCEKRGICMTFLAGLLCWCEVFNPRIWKHCT